MKPIIFKGCGTALATPFDEQGINFKVFGEMIENQIENGVDALIVCGTTGESSTMTEKERKDAIKFVVDVVKKRVSVIAGTGSNNTAQAMAMSKYAEEVGADGCLVVTPYYNKTTQGGLIAHYSAVASSTKLPIILYSVASRTGTQRSTVTCLELSKIPNIVAIKEASGNISQIAKIAELCGDNLHIYSGNDDQVIPIMSLGGLGVISVLSNVAPKYTHDMCQNFFDGKLDEALKMQLNALSLINALFCEVNPIPVKYALKLSGYDFGNPRLPLVELTDKNKVVLENEMKKMRLI